MMIVATMVVMKKMMMTMVVIVRGNLGMESRQRSGTKPHLGQRSRTGSQNLVIMMRNMMMNIRLMMMMMKMMIAIIMAMRMMKPGMRGCRQRRR